MLKKKKKSYKGKCTQFTCFSDTTRQHNTVIVKLFKSLSFHVKMYLDNIRDPQSAVIFYYPLSVNGRVFLHKES